MFCFAGVFWGVAAAVAGSSGGVVWVSRVLAISGFCPAGSGATTAGVEAGAGLAIGAGECAALDPVISGVAVAAAGASSERYTVASCASSSPSLKIEPDGALVDKDKTWSGVVAGSVNGENLNKKIVVRRAALHPESYSVGVANGAVSKRSERVRPLRGVAGGSVIGGSKQNEQNAGSLNRARNCVVNGRIKCKRHIWSSSWLLLLLCSRRMSLLVMGTVVLFPGSFCEFENVFLTLAFFNLGTTSRSLLASTHPVLNDDDDEPGLNPPPLRPRLSPCVLEVWHLRRYCDGHCTLCRHRPTPRLPRSLTTSRSSRTRLRSRNNVSTRLLFYLLCQVANCSLPSCV